MKEADAIDTDEGIREPQLESSNPSSNLLSAEIQNMRISSYTPFAGNGVAIGSDMPSIHQTNVITYNAPSNAKIEDKRNKLVKPNVDIEGSHT